MQHMAQKPVIELKKDSSALDAHCTVLSKNHNLYGQSFFVFIVVSSCPYVSRQH